MRMQLKVSES